MRAPRQVEARPGDFFTLNTTTMTKQIMLQKLSQISDLVVEMAKMADAQEIVKHCDLDTPPDRGEGFSHDVLIDINGKKTDFRVGWYDHDEKEWRLYDVAALAEFEIDFATWRELPK